MIKKIVGVFAKELIKAGGMSAVTAYGSKVGDAAGEATIKVASWIRSKISPEVKEVSSYKSKREPRK